MRELVSGSHERLGDAVLAAQESYAQTGQMPELLSVYHLLGDPGMRIRWAKLERGVTGRRGPRDDER
jgi:hypothetical protein